MNKITNPVHPAVQAARALHADSPPVLFDILAANIGEFAKGPFLSCPEEVKSDEDKTDWWLDQVQLLVDEAVAVVADSRFTPAQKVARTERLASVADSALFQLEIL
jgi:hypothetical protein